VARLSATHKRAQEEGGGWGGGGQGEETARLVRYRRERISDAR